MKNHTNYVSSICLINKGKWICTGSNDSTICVYNFGEANPFVTLKDHTGTVSALSEGLESNILFSGSWDQTARIWNNLDANSASVELKGHEAAVLCVTGIKKSEKYATGSADKNIFIWNSRGEKLAILKGHTDCVRGIVSMDDGSLLSCANDASIRHWNDSWETIREFHGHSNYIYTIALNPALGNDVFVTGSEDNTIRMWSTARGALGDSITLPAQSVWSVFCTDNGDIISGSSDAVVRVFTNNSDRFGSDDLRNAFDLAVQTKKLEQNKDLGEIKVNDLPGPESLLQEGTEGEIRFVRHPDGKIMCYRWFGESWE
jgi:phospholipase A-2-activating protein